MKKTLVYSVCLSFSLFGCANTPLDYKTGTEITQAQISQFTVGKTLQNEVVNSVGQPNRKEALGAKEVWYYDFNKVGAFFNGNVSEATVFEWDASGKLLQVYKTGKSAKTGNALLDAANASSI
jgi:outer membrane protein assembly factor BamE (lipoprotein component of BamABCDE complex)